MGAALGNQNPIPVRQRLQRQRAPDRLGQVSLIAREQDGKGGQKNVLRRLSVRQFKDLAVCDHKLRLSPQAGKRL